jgi:hypothetical protein
VLGGLALSYLVWNSIGVPPERREVQVDGDIAGVASAMTSGQLYATSEPDLLAALGNVPGGTITVHLDST